MSTSIFVLEKINLIQMVIHYKYHLLLINYTVKMCVLKLNY
jgi:hypothetical protein